MSIAFVTLFTGHISESQLNKLFSNNSSQFLDWISLFAWRVFYSFSTRHALFTDYQITDILVTKWENKSAKKTILASRLLARINTFSKEHQDEFYEYNIRIRNIQDRLSQLTQTQKDNKDEPPFLALTRKLSANHLQWMYKKVLQDNSSLPLLIEQTGRYGNNELLKILFDDPKIKAIDPVLFQRAIRRAYRIACESNDLSSKLLLQEGLPPTTLPEINNDLENVLKKSEIELIHHLRTSKSNEECASQVINKISSENFQLTNLEIALENGWINIAKKLLKDQPKHLVALQRQINSPFLYYMERSIDLWPLVYRTNKSLGLPNPKDGNYIENFEIFLKSLIHSLNSNRNHYLKAVNDSSLGKLGKNTYKVLKKFRATYVQQLRRRLVRDKKPTPLARKIYANADSQLKAFLGALTNKFSVKDLCKLTSEGCDACLDVLIARRINLRSSVENRETLLHELLLTAQKKPSDQENFLKAIEKIAKYFPSEEVWKAFNHMGSDGKTPLLLMLNLPLTPDQLCNTLTNCGITIPDIFKVDEKVLLDLEKCKEKKLTQFGIQLYLKDHMPADFECRVINVITQIIAPYELWDLFDLLSSKYPRTFSEALKRHIEIAETESEIEVVKKVIAKIKDIDSIKCDHNNNLIHHSILFKKYTLIKPLCQAGVLMGEWGKDGLAPLELAVALKDSEAVRTILDVARTMHIKPYLIGLAKALNICKDKEVNQLLQKYQEDISCQFPV